MATSRRYGELDGGMVDELLDDDTIEQLLAGRPIGERADLQALSSFVDTLRSASTTVPAVVRPELVAIFEACLATGEVPSVAASDQPIPRSPRRRRMLEALAAFVATLAGKVVLGTAAVAAGVGGAHAAGVVDVPGLPDRTPSAVVDAPAVDDPADQSDDHSRPDVETGEPDDPGVDGSTVSDRATSGEPQEDGKAFGSSVADEATEGTPAEDLPANPGDAADDRQPDASDVADDHKSDTPPADGADAAEQHKPDTVDGANPAENDRPDGAPTDRP